MLRLVEDHLRSSQVSRVIYGAIIGLALVVALEQHSPPAAVMVGTLLATALAVRRAELYSEIVGTETRTRARVERRQLLDILDEVAAVAIGIAFPAVFFLLAAAGALELDTAFNFAKWSGLALICAYGYFAARLAGSRTTGALLHAAAVGAIGGVLIALKAVLH